MVLQKGIDCGKCPETDAETRWKLIDKREEQEQNIAKDLVFQEGHTITQTPSFLEFSKHAQIYLLDF